MFVLTGGGSGIGKALAKVLAMRGQSVLIIGRTVDTLKETASFSTLIDYVCADVSTEMGRSQLLSYLGQYRKIDGLIHNAGIIEPIVPITDIDLPAWRQVMATNLEAPLFLNQMLQDKLVNNRVLHIGSGAAHFPVKGWSAYCVSKAALHMLTQCWQIECERVSFASVMPGIIDTDMQEKIRQSSEMDPEKVHFFKKLKKEKRLITPETVALFLAWLLLDVEKGRYESKEWDIYDKTHHHEWLISPHQVPLME